ncbi:hypothetical protein DRN50_04905 [Thermococci archaeon]|nr:MAG: hypothetical protein DRN50_04905 [Thermococci archaeon]
MNRNFYKKMKNYKEIKEFSQNEYIRIADMNKLNEIAILLEKRNELIESPFNWSNRFNGS